MRKSLPLTPYKLKCEKDGLNSRLGPPDFHPPTSDSPEENLTKEYVQFGYKETVEGLEEAKEITLSQVHNFSKPVVLKCKEAVRKCLRAINDSRAQKRKAGQVYGVPLSGSLLCKPGFPEQRPCGEETKKKWIEGLSQQHKRLCSVADHIPHGYRRKYLFEVLIRNNVPLLRATWFVKVTYLNQVRPGSSALSSGLPDKTQSARCELWTKDIIDYLQYLYDELLSRNNSYPTHHARVRSPQMLYTGSMQKINPASTSAPDGEEPSLHLKWWYMVRLLQWHHAEGLLLPNLIIDWVLKLLQENEVFEILQLLLPIVYGVLESIVLSQTYVRSLVAIAVRFIQEPSPGGSDLVDNSRRAYTLSALIEMVRYLILSAPDTFVASDCFPLPPSVGAYGPNDASFASKAFENLEKLKSGSAEVSSSQFQGRGTDPRFEFLSFDHIISTIQRSADDLANIASAGYPQHNVAKAVQALDKALSDGDIRAAYSHLFEDLSNGAIDEAWIAEVSPCLRSSLRWIGSVSTSFVCSVFFLLEWATCDFRAFQSGVPKDIKFTGRKDYSQVYLVIQLLKQNILGMDSGSRRKNRRNSFLGISGISRSMDVFESPGPLHDIIVCWIDQHEVHSRGSKPLQLLIFELIRSRIFYPIAYARQLMVSGMIDAIRPAVELERRMRHHRILKQLPGVFIRDTLEEVRILGGAKLSEAVKIFSNERRLLLRELEIDGSKYLDNVVLSDKSLKRKHKPCSFASIGISRPTNAMTNAVLEESTKSSMDIGELKELISALLHFPDVSSSGMTESVPDDSQCGLKRSGGSFCSNMDQAEATPGCEDCRRTKRPKLNEEKSSFIQGYSPIASDEEDNWWTRKGSNTMESSMNVDPPSKSIIKQVQRGRQKTVRKTQSLAQLQAARIEGSQGASTSHVCGNKVSCPHHGRSTDGENHKVVDAVRTSGVDVVSIGNFLKQLRFVERRSITVWLTAVVRQLVEATEKSIVRVGQFSRGVPVEEKSSARWKLGEDELSAIIHLMDSSLDFVSAVKFLLWVLPKTSSSPSFTIQGGRNLLVLPKNVESHTCEVGEAFLVSSLQRYENILLASNLVPEALSALTSRAAVIMASNGKLPSSGALVYARCLLKRYGSLASVVEWQKNFKATCDKRLMYELDLTRSDGEYGIPLGVPAEVDNPDDYLRQKIGSTRLSRVGANMRDVVQRHVDEASLYFRKLVGAGMMKGSFAEKNGDRHQFAQRIIAGLMDCIRQTGGAAQEGDPSLVSSAVSAIVNSAGSAIARISDFFVGNNYQNHSSSSIGSYNIARYILHIHITCLCLLKDALGVRQSRVFEIALATESYTALAGVFSPGKASRNQYQLSPEAYDSNPSPTNEMLNNTGKIAFSRATKTTAAVSALVVGAIVHGVITLERMVGLLRLRECLDFVQFARSTKSSSNGSARSVGTFKVENSIEVYVHWFRLLVGNCRTVSEGLVLEFVGEPSVVAISRMQRMLPLNLVFPPTYAILAFVLWMPFVLSSNSSMHEDTRRLYQSLTMAINDVIKHLPFRDVCLRDTRALYDLIVADPTDAEFASVLELNGLDMHSKAFVPLRARLFLNALIDSKVPASVYSQEGGSEAKFQHQGNVAKLRDKLVSVVDSLQPAKFHWQWVELRLLLNEQALIDKLENHDMSLTEAIRSSCPTSENPDASEHEKNFIEIILTRLLVRPDAVRLFSESVHLLGRSVEDSMLKQAEWVLSGHDALLGRKTIRQKLATIAERKGYPIKPQSRKPWGWCNSSDAPMAIKTPKKKMLEITSIEEGEVVEGVDSKKMSSRAIEELHSYGHEITTERAFVELVLPCIDHSSDRSQSTFLNELSKQFSQIEQLISSATRSSNKQTGTISVGSEISSNKAASTRKGIRGGSPNTTKKLSTVTPESVPPSPAALRASMSLRLQFLLRLLPVICGEPSSRSIRLTLASTMIRLLGTRVVYEDSTVCSPPRTFCSSNLSKAEMESMFDPSASEALFDRFLFVLHGLLSNHQPCWLKTRPVSKPLNESPKDFSPFDRDSAESLQNELERMQLPDTVRWRIQAAMPILLPYQRCSLMCQPLAVVPATALSLLQPSLASGFTPGASSTPPQRNSISMAKMGNTAQGKLRQTPAAQQQQELDSTEIDPWMLLEDGTGSGPSSNGSSSDHVNLRAASWLKGAVRVRRTELTYIGSVDEDS
ncbi:PREDICTED: mediator of RNA polymerase II transcription subunit 12-like isoform X2 [Tarenaya hassleriana]|uniref:mediator of RNA polymerase II transcription subunit 12-like isoform X2 n=1 Tax=Tarenaya hassleriana TaxID=28532 RepID=UPI00053C842A|nr:PREDICTED: mediator of RNA polymerase II transcription subunit 12-like isoform X2 [Tarenaya hassleriana]